MHGPQLSFSLKQSHLISLLVIGIMLLGGFLRVYDLSTLPNGLNRDEAALAYNAYLLMKTGKDEWGREWPLALESFGDYKLPGYPLTMIGSFTLFGVSDFAVRAPSAIAGILFIGMTYVFCRRALKLKTWSSVLMTCAVAIQPVFVFYSRMAWEANVGLLFFVSGLTLVLTECKQTMRRLLADLIASGCFLLALFTYNTPLLLLPFVLVSLPLTRGIKNWRTYVPMCVAVATLFLIGVASLASISQQKSGITIFSDETYWQKSVEHYQSFQGVAQKVLGNRYVFFGKVIIENFFKSWSPEFLTQRGGQHPWHNLPNHGHILLATYILGLVGLGQVFRNTIVSCKEQGRRSFFVALLFLLFTSLAPAIITVDAPHATRSLFFFFLLTCFGGYGIEMTWAYLSQKSDEKNTFKVMFVALAFIGLTFEVRHYYYEYFSAYREESRSILRAGLGDTLQALEKSLDQQDHQDDRVAIVDPDGYLYTQVAWSLKLTPEQFHSTITRHLPDRIGFKYGYRVGRYRFIAHREDRLPEDTQMVEWNPTIHRWMMSR